MIVLVGNCPRFLGDHLLESTATALVTSEATTTPLSSSRAHTCEYSIAPPGVLDDNDSSSDAAFFSATRNFRTNGRGLVVDLFAFMSTKVCSASLVVWLAQRASSASDWIAKDSRAAMEVNLAS